MLGSQPWGRCGVAAIQRALSLACVRAALLSSIIKCLSRKNRQVMTGCLFALSPPSEKDDAQRRSSSAGRVRHQASPMLSRASSQLPSRLPSLQPNPLSRFSLDLSCPVLPRPVVSHALRCPRLSSVSIPSFAPTSALGEPVPFPHR